MFLAEITGRMRSLFSDFVIGALTVVIVLSGANIAVAQAKNAAKEADSPATERQPNALTGRKKLKAPLGGAANKYLDFTGNGTTDFVTLAFTEGGPITWHVLGNPASPVPYQAFIRRFDYGLANTDAIAVGDYIGDNKTDLNVYRTTTNSAQGIFYVAQFPNGAAPVALNHVQWWGNSSTDETNVGDYDGDGKADYTVIRIEDEVVVWYILFSATNTGKRIIWGRIPPEEESAGVPTVFNGADFNGDGRDELIYVTTNSDGSQVNYFIGDAQTGAEVYIPFKYGNYNTDYTLPPADYTGDGKADFVACRFTDTDRVLTWYILNSATGQLTVRRFGIADPGMANADFPVRGDYDGDNRHDVAVWRPSNQTFYWISSQTGALNSQPFGQPDEIPLAALNNY